MPYWRQPRLRRSVILAVVLVMDPRTFHHRLANALIRCLGPHESVVCAVSGGVDSVVMLHALHQVNRRKRLGLTLHAAHIDHGLRDDSAEDAEWVGTLAGRLGLPFTGRRVYVPALLRRERSSIEEAARKARYNALEQMAIDLGATCVAVAHHADDQAETVLHHIIRGTGMAGLAGMAAARPIRDESPVLLIRPMLEFTREEIEDYAGARGLEFREDSTNLDVSLTRNRIRRQLLPLLGREFNPRVVEALVRLANHARDAAEIVADIATDLLAVSTVGITKGVAQLDVATLTRVPAAVVREAIRQALVRLGTPLQSLDQERLAAVLSLTEGDGRRRTVELPGRFAAQRRGKLLLLGPASVIRSMSDSGRTPSARKEPKRAGRVWR